jgi:hypothetical protein
MNPLSYFVLKVSLLTLTVVQPWDIRSINAILHMWRLSHREIKWMAEKEEIIHERSIKIINEHI